MGPTFMDHNYHPLQGAEGHSNFPSSLIADISSESLRLHKACLEGGNRHGVCMPSLVLILELEDNTASCSSSPVPVSKDKEQSSWISRVSNSLSGSSDSDAVEEVECTSPILIKAPLAWIPDSGEIMVTMLTWREVVEAAPAKLSIAKIDT